MPQDHQVLFMYFMYSDPTFYETYSMHNLCGIDDGSDLRLGKVTALLLPEEDMLERFVSNVTEKDESWRTTKKNINVFRRVKRVSPCNWWGFVCNEKQQVEEINFARACILTGSLH